MNASVTYKWLRSSLGLVAGLLACLGLTLSMAAPAKAEVTAAPELVTVPTDPQTTNFRTTFEYTVGEDEASTVSPLRFYCRVYDSSTTPTANSGWGTCGQSTSDQPLSRSYIQANGSWTFEVALRETTNISTQGPSASHSWTQAIPAPSQPPVILTQPDPVVDQVNSLFEYREAEGDETLADRAECRVDGGDWVTCGSKAGNTFGEYSTAPSNPYGGKFLGNGEHTVEVRLANIAGFGPAIEPITWTIDVPDPNPSVTAEEVTSAVWQGRDAGAHAGLTPGGTPYKSIGDLNGDGLDDLVIPSTSGAQGVIDVIYGSASMGGDQLLGDQSATKGYRIILPGSSAAIGVAPAGDQNDDGKDDLAVRFTNSPFGFPPYQVGVIYGGLDTNDLPTCPGLQARCLSVASLTDDQGYILSPPFGASAGMSFFASGGDFDGDGKDDLYLANEYTGAYVIKGGVERTGVVSVASLPNAEMLEIVFPSGNGGRQVSALGDIDGDGNEDLFVQEFGASNNQSRVVYGRSFGEGTLDVDTMSSDDGFSVYAGRTTYVSAIGDVTGDGLPELVAVKAHISGFGSAETGIVVFTPPERGTDGYRVIGEDPTELEGSGYIISGSDAGIDTFLGMGETNTQSGVASVGDFNNDGVADFLSGASMTPLDGIPGGAGYLLFGQSQFPYVPIKLGGNLTPDIGVAVKAPDGVNRFTHAFAPLGDLDGDGLTDFSLGAPYATVDGNANAGAVYIIYGKSLINQVKTGRAVGVGNESAVVTAGLSTNNRDSEVWFEYGTTDEYGESTDPVEFEASRTGDGASAALGGLVKNTTYHYRAVAKNELGLVRYGDDRTFTTSNDPDPQPIDPCDANPGAAGCAKYCEVNPTAMGCPDYDWCANNPGKCNQGGPSKARIALVSPVKRIAVRRGKRGVIPVAVVNTGGKAVGGVRVCVRAPKRLVRTPRCIRVGVLRSGASKIVRVRVAVKRNARRGLRAKHALTAAGKGVAPRRARAVVVIR